MSDDAAIDAIIRKANVEGLAHEMFVLQVGHHGGTWQPNDHALQHETYRKMARECISAAEAFFTESQLPPGDYTRKSNP